MLNHDKCTYEYSDIVHRNSMLVMPKMLGMPFSTLIIVISDLYQQQCKTSPYGRKENKNLHLVASNYSAFVMY
jgi:hypothetical protein